MPSISYYCRKARDLPPQVVIKKVRNKLSKWIKNRSARSRDLSRPSFLLDLLVAPSLAHQLGGEDVPELGEESAGNLVLLCNHYLEHRFDLLGSGWVQVRRGMSCRGLEGHRYEATCPSQPECDYLDTENFKEIKRIRSLIPDSYQPIDWHLDFKSGYRWEPKTWYRDVPYGHLLGVDIKVPWELARMQHLPQLALAFGCARRKLGVHGVRNPKTYVDEFRNQVLDFIAANPPRYGVNWVCTMDVAIRMANWLVAYDLFRASGTKFDEEFETIFIRSVYEHGHHIINNLEWNEGVRGNHYLADIAGLLFVSAHLTRTDEIDVWLAFSVQQLINEVQFQFTSDGANFEASTSYHRLSAEMVVYSTALILGLPEEKKKALIEYDCKFHKVKPAIAPASMHFDLCGDSASIFPKWYFERIEKMAEFTLHITKPDGKIPQIGDNDSGRFLKLWPVYNILTVAEAKLRYANLATYTNLPDDAKHLDEQHLDHRHLVAAINGIFHREDFALFAGNARVECKLISKLAKTKIASYSSRLGNYDANSMQCSVQSLVNSGLGIPPAEQCKVTEIVIPDDVLDGTMLQHAYPNFGLYLFRTPRFYLSVRCGSVGLNGLGGHAHNDQLSIELSVDSEDWIADPGTYIYTPLADARNRYRSASAHFVPRIGDAEPGKLDLHLFSLGGSPSGHCLYFGESGFVGVHYGYGMALHRKVEFKGNRVVITDWADVPDIFESGHSVLTRNIIPRCSVPFSPGYGIVYSNKLHE